MFVMNVSRYVNETCEIMHENGDGLHGDIRGDSSAGRCQAPKSHDTQRVSIVNV